MEITINKYLIEIIASLPLFFGDLEEPKEEVKAVEQETVVTPRPIKQGPQKKKQQELLYEATFYTAFCDTGCIGITSSGYDVSNTIYYEGMRILAAPKNIPLYTVFNVTLEDGENFKAIVLDRGGDIKGNRIDILVKDRAYAYKKGRQIATMQEVK